MDSGMKLNRIRMVLRRETIFVRKVWRWGNLKGIAHIHMIDLD